ncbi:hypothetical protein [Shewanella atlantica]|uniref:DUF304 domain-containing protein n=1 Tax=Shewanella atlantica TaxID=271099 RepID=A0A3S0RRQ6_9GAMM|nr:hypothetical protein [Shewanella atlantica]RTR34727.1 hypothetical protein EKG39_03445 [Shewanella atlantica]
MQFFYILIPLALVLVIYLERKYIKEHDEKYSGLDLVTMSHFVSGITWFASIVALILLAQTFVDPPNSVIGHLGFAAFFVLCVVIAVQNRTHRLYFDETQIVRTRIIGAPMVSTLADLKQVELKSYSDSSSETYILTFTAGKPVKIPIGMMEGEQLAKLKTLLNRYKMN